MKKILLVVLVLAAAGALALMYREKSVRASGREFTEAIEQRKEEARINAATDVRIYRAIFGKCGYVSLRGDNIQGIRATTVSVTVNDEFISCLQNPDYVKNLRLFCDGLNFRKGDKLLVMRSTDEKVLMSYDLKGGFRIAG